MSSMSRGFGAGVKGGSSGGGGGQEGRAQQEGSKHSLRSEDERKIEIDKQRRV